MPQDQGSKSRLLGLLAARFMGSSGGSYLSVVTLISMAGVVLGVSSLLIIFSIVTGFEDTFREKLLGVYPHAVVIGPGADVPDWRALEARVAAMPEARRVSAATYDEMMISSLGGQKLGVLVKGVVPGKGPGVPFLRRQMLEGNLDALELAPLVKWDAKAGRLEVSQVPGGRFWTFVLGPDGPRALGPGLENRGGRGASLRVVSGSPEPCVLKDLFSEETPLTAGPEGSDWFAAGPGLVHLRAGGQDLPLELDEGDCVTVVLDGLGGHWVLKEEWSVVGSADGAVALLNLAGQPVTLVVEGRTLEVAAGASVTQVARARPAPPIILGSGLARSLEVGVGGEVSLVSPFQGATRFERRKAGSRPASRAFRVVGIVELGFYEYDSRLALVHFDDARAFLMRGDRARWVEVEGDDLENLDGFIASLERTLAAGTLDKLGRSAQNLSARLESLLDHRPLEAGASALDRIAYFQDLAAQMRFAPQEDLGLGLSNRHRIISWKDMNRSMFSAMQRQRIVLSLFFLIIIVVAAFNIVGSQAMMVREKQSQIALLKVLGLRDSQVAVVFTLHGLFIGLVGTAVGLCLGVGGSLALGYFGFPLDPVVYYVDTLPVRLVWSDVAFVGVAAALLVFGAVLVSALRAAARAPVEGLTRLD
jgi:ABC-type lipoprotein release transport system permease subunit